MWDLLKIIYRAHVNVNGHEGTCFWTTMELYGREERDTVRINLLEVWVFS